MDVNKPKHAYNKAQNKHFTLIEFFHSKSSVMEQRKEVILIYLAEWMFDLSL